MGGQGTAQSQGERERHTSCANLSNKGEGTAHLQTPSFGKVELNMSLVGVEVGASLQD